MELGQQSKETLERLRQINVYRGTAESNKAKSYREAIAEVQKIRRGTGEGGGAL
jgi:hypothetical protein